MTNLRVCGGCKVNLESLDSLLRESRLFLCVVGVEGKTEERKGRTAEWEGKTEDRNERTEERKGVEMSWQRDREEVETSRS